MHKGMVLNLKCILEQWKKKLSSGSHLVLGKCFNFYLYLQKAELIGILSSVYLYSSSPNFSSFPRFTENLLVMLISKWRLSSTKLLVLRRMQGPAEL